MKDVWGHILERTRLKDGCSIRTVTAVRIRSVTSLYVVTWKPVRFKNSPRQGLKQYQLVYRQKVSRLKSEHMRVPLAKETQ